MLSQAISKKKYFQHLEELKEKNNYKHPTFIMSTNTALDKESNISTVEYYLNTNKPKEIKPIL